MVVYARLRVDHRGCVAALLFCCRVNLKPPLHAGCRWTTTCIHNSPTDCIIVIFTSDCQVILFLVFRSGPYHDVVNAQLKFLGSTCWTTCGHGDGR
jgi:hypothetical protein